jgi:hypothetical protein
MIAVPGACGAVLFDVIVTPVVGCDTTLVAVAGDTA